MKKIITLVAVLLITFSATAQKKKAKKANDNTCYLEAAAQTFKLSDENTAKLTDLLTERFEQRASIRKKTRNSELSKEDAKTESKAINQSYFKSFADLAGKSKKEIMSFEKATKKKCN